MIFLYIILFLRFLDKLKLYPHKKFINNFCFYREDKISTYDIYSMIIALIIKLR